MQGLFVGNWGEMHSSRYTTDSTLCKLYRAFRESNMGDLFLALRTPDRVKLMQKENEKILRERPDAKNLFGLGLFDDAIFGDDTDLGTFHPDSKEEELTFVAEQCAMGSVGGEVLGGSLTPSAEEIVNRLRRMRVTYLNSRHDLKRLDSFKKMTFEKKNLYDYIGNHLGYRLFVRQILWKKKQGELSVTIENRGFCDLLEKSVLRVMIYRKIMEDSVYKNEVKIREYEGSRFMLEQRLEQILAPAEWKEKNVLTVTFALDTLPKGQYLLSLEMFRRKDQCRIVFANVEKDVLERLPMTQS